MPNAQRLDRYPVRVLTVQFAIGNETSLLLNKMYHHYTKETLVFKVLKAGDIFRVIRLTLNCCLLNLLNWKVVQDERLIRLDKSHSAVNVTRYPTRHHPRRRS
jgi:hypothetical protein